MNQFTSDVRRGSNLPKECARYADEITQMDEPGIETEARASARAHLSRCPRCQQERRDQLTAHAALDTRLRELMAQAPTLTVADIAAKAASPTSPRASNRVRAKRTTEMRSPQGQPSSDMRPAQATPRWRRVVAAGSSVAAIALITTLLAITLTGHFPGQPGGPRSGTPTAISLSDYTVYAPTAPKTQGGSTVVAFRASDGAPQPNATPSAPFTLGLAAFAQGVRYQLTPQSTSFLQSASVTSSDSARPMTLSATRISDDKTLWSEKVSASYATELIFSNGALYFASANEIASFNSLPDAVYAYRASDGALLWSHELLARTTSNLLVANRAIYTMVGKTVYALRQDNGALLWQKALTIAQPNTLLGASFIDFSNSLYIYAYSGPDTSTGLVYDNAVDIFDLRLSDGSIVWQTPLGHDSPVMGGVTPIVANGSVYIRLASSPYSGSPYTLRLVALDASNGAMRWTYTIKMTATQEQGAPNIYAPAVSADGSVVYLDIDGGGLTALRASDRSVLWQVNVASGAKMDIYPSSVNSPVYVNGTLFLMVNRQVVAVRASDGDVIWRANTGLPSGAALAFNLVVEPNAVR